jgi:hypothetical protein
MRFTNANFTGSVVGFAHAAIVVVCMLTTTSSLAQAPSVWHARWVKDQLTDKTRLEASTQAATSRTKYQLDYKCDESGERLEISTFDENGSAKRIPWDDKVAHWRFFNIRIDSGDVELAEMFGGDYFNAATLWLIGGPLAMVQPSRLLPMTQSRSLVLASKSLVLANIFADEQFLTAVDFPPQFRSDCERMTKPLRDKIRANFAVSK